MRANAVVKAHDPRLIVVDEQHRPIGTVSCLEVLAALTNPGISMMGVDKVCRFGPRRPVRARDSHSGVGNKTT